MSTKVTASQLRADIYRILDRVLETGEPVEIERKGQVLQIRPAEKPKKGRKKKSKLDNLVPHPGFIKGDPEDLVHMDWYDEWNPDPT